MRLYLDLSPGLHIDATLAKKFGSHFLKEENLALQLLSLNIVPFINDMFKPSYNRYNTKLPMTLDTHLRIQGSKLYLFLDQKHGLN